MLCIIDFFYNFIWQRYLSSFLFTNKRNERFLTILKYMHLIFPYYLGFPSFSPCYPCPFLTISYPCYSYHDIMLFLSQGFSLYIPFIFKFSLIVSLIYRVKHLLTVPTLHLILTGFYSFFCFYPRAVFLLFFTFSLERFTYYLSSF